MLHGHTRTRITDPMSCTEDNWCSWCRGWFEPAVTTNSFLDAQPGLAESLIEQVNRNPTLLEAIGMLAKNGGTL